MIIVSNKYCRPSVQFFKSLGGAARNRLRDQVAVSTFWADR